MDINPLAPEVNPSAQRCLTRFFTGDFYKSFGVKGLIWLVSLKNRYGTRILGK
jgi:hypothetical protein